MYALLIDSQLADLGSYYELVRVVVVMSCIYVRVHV
eukprot:COSAG01_NODE_2202_length_8174_cov_44.528050_10_plen_36_part_00